MLQSPRRQVIDIIQKRKVVIEMAVVDLFCGCGGLSKGFEQAGFDIVAAYDGWQPALDCYNANFDHDAQRMDLNDVEHAVEVIAALQPTVIVGGPPCQEFSNAGRREEGDLANLTYRYAEIVTRLLPDYFVMENVPRAQSSNAYARARELYVQSGYGLTEVVLDASRCGVPQKRNRFFCIGAHNAPDNFLLGRIFKFYIGEPVSVAQYFANNNIPLDIEAYYRHPTTYNRRGIFDVNEVAPTIRGVNRPRPATYTRHPNDAAPDVNLAQISKLTLRQRATIQTFPQDFVFDGLEIAQCDLEQMVGNAVPVSLAHFVAARLQEYIQDLQGGNANMDERTLFAEWLRAEKGYSDRSISDVFSRLNRAAGILPDHEINRYYIVDLENEPRYQELGTSIKSQIRKAINLKLAFLRQINPNE